MISKYLTPVPADLHFIFGEPKDGKPIYEQQGTFSQAQAWFRALQRVVGDVVPLTSVSMFVPVSRTAIHSRISEGRLSCFRFKIEDTDPKVSPSLNRERPHAFVPVSECLLWFQEYHDRLVLRENGVPPDCSASELFFGFGDTSFDFHSKKHEGIWKEPLEEFQKKYTEHTHKKALENLPEEERKKYES